MKSRAKAAREFEVNAAKVFSEAAHLDSVQHDARVRGKSGSLRQVDVLISGSVGALPIVVAVDAKLRKGKVKRQDVLNIIDIAEDIGANQAVVVAENGFDSGARRLAETKGVQLLDAVDSKNTKWVNRIRFAAYFHIEFLIFTVSDDLPLDLIKTLAEFLKEQWNKNELPKELYNLSQADSKFVRTFSFSLGLTKGDLVVGSTEVSFTVKHIFRRGLLPLQLLGLFNPKNSSFIAPSVSTEKIALSDMISSWEKVSFSSIPKGKVIFQLSDIVFAENLRDEGGIDVQDRQISFEVIPEKGSFDLSLRSQVRLLVKIEKFAAAVEGEPSRRVEL